jgi:hypothetical protein
MMKGSSDGAGRQNLIANHPSLIANETHSREKSSACKQSTYKILIANEFHLQKTPLEHHFSQLGGARGKCIRDCMRGGMVYVMAAQASKSAGPPRKNGGRSEEQSE